MANKLQKGLYTISTLSPMIVCEAGVQWYKDGCSLVVGVMALVGLAASLYVLWLVYQGKKLIPPTMIQAKSCPPMDITWPIGVFLSYFFPVLAAFVGVLSLWVLGCVFGLLALFFTISNNVLPNTILLLCGYHFYNVENLNGQTEYCLISRRTRIHDPSTLKKVICVFDYFLLEVE